MIFYNSLNSKKEEFIPLNINEIKMYVCGPTVYNRIHLGNARSIVVYDVLLRFLLKIYKKVIYVRNITDIDDKIIIEAKNRNISENDLTKEMITHFQEDCNYLNCLSPTFEPKVTDNLNEIIDIIQKLIINEHAYISNGEVFFDIQSFNNYGNLSKRKIQNNIINLDKNSHNKKHPEDFALWKKTSEGIQFNSPWGLGRPGWHIECSAMAYRYLGENFDIHGGGVDLKFPHHENEIAQSQCAFKNSIHAKYWIHNGFLMVNGEKMSKSLNNFITVQDYRNKKMDPNIIRIAFLLTDYKKPINLTDKLISDSEKIMKKFYKFNQENKNFKSENKSIDEKVYKILSQDLNTSKLIAEIMTEGLKNQNRNFFYSAIDTLGIAF